MQTLTQRIKNILVGVRKKIEETTPVLTVRDSSKSKGWTSAKSAAVAPFPPQSATNTLQKSGWAWVQLPKTFLAKEASSDLSEFNILATAKKEQQKKSHTAAVLNCWFSNRQATSKTCLGYSAQTKSMFIYYSQKGMTQHHHQGQKKKLL